MTVYVLRSAELRSTSGPRRFRLPCHPTFCGASQRRRRLSSRAGQEKEQGPSPLFPSDCALSWKKKRRESAHARRSQPPWASLFFSTVPLYPETGSVSGAQAGLDERLRSAASHLTESDSPVDRETCAAVRLSEGFQFQRMRHHLNTRREERARESTHRDNGAGCLWMPED